MSNYGKKPTRRVAKNPKGAHGVGTGAGANIGARASANADANASSQLGELLVSRRGFLYGAAGIAALVIAGGVGIGITSTQTASAQDIPILEVPTSSVFTTDDCQYLEDYSDYMKLVGSVALPYGTLVWANCNSLATCLLPTATGSPLASIGIIDLSSFGWGTLLTHAVSESEGYEIYDVRGTESGIVWTEADILDGNWRIYAAKFTQSPSAPQGTAGDDLSFKLDEPVMVSEGGSDWDTPTLTVWENFAYWQELPKATGDASDQNSLLKRYVFGAAPSTVETVYESPGRMACAPSSTTDGIVFAPRAQAVNVYYQLTYIDGSTAKELDRLTLPASMRPTEISYGKTGFAFCFDGIYSYGDGISNLGTYTATALPAVTYGPASEKTIAAMASEKKVNQNELTDDEINQAELRAQIAVTEEYDESQWLNFARTPLCPPAWCGNYFMVKSSTAIAGIDLGSQQYFTLTVENGAPDYGEFMASEGTSRNIVTYTQIDYTPINGETIYQCRLKLWEPK